MKILSGLLAGAAFMALATPALAGDGWYLGAGGGGIWPSQTNWTVPVTTESGHYTFNATGAGLADVGYKWTNGFRLEVEYQFADLPTNTITEVSPLPGSSALHGHLTTNTFYANAAYDFAFSGGWGATVGGGVGEALTNAHATIVASGDSASGNKSVLAWQADAGIIRELCPNVDLQLDYRYQSISQAHYFIAAIPGNFDSAAINSSSVMLSLRWYLESPPPPPPPPLPPPPPPPPPPPLPPVTNFIVFFDFNKSNLTAEAQSVVAEAVKAAKSGHFVKILVTGHTDTVGSDSYNQGLSVRRAESVKDEMVREGLDGSTIAIEGKSFHDPLVPTGPGVREPQNRRAVINLGG